ncbi:MAG: hypothetical protein ACLUD2_00890 [Clostridium sp.]
MGSINVTGYCADNFFILVQDHIQDKADSRSFCSKEHIFMNWISFQNA